MHQDEPGDQSKNSRACHNGATAQTQSIVTTKVVSPLKIGLFPYLNVQPLIFGLRDSSDVELVIDVPSRISERFKTGDLDLAMVPSYDAVSLGAPILDSVCIASDGPVETVMLHHRVPLDRVKTLALDRASRTSAALARILIAEASGQRPKTSLFSPAEGESGDADALLVIGDPAFSFRRIGFDALDLGQEWRRTTSLPFVFAVMVAGPRSLPKGISRRIGKATRRGVAAASTIALTYNSGIEAGRAERYLRDVIRYDLGSRERQGLTLFSRRAEANGLFARAGELQFHAM
jgi:chorismate dehydratase